MALILDHIDLEMLLEEHPEFTDVFVPLWPKTATKYHDSEHG